MKILISPAKSLDFENAAPTDQYSEAIFLEDALKLNKTLKMFSQKDISELMSISVKLGDLNWQRNQDWSLPFSTENAKQAVYAFKGDVYLGLDIETLPKEKLGQIQEKLRILSGLYGLLKPLDLMQPYRLEMGTKLKMKESENLYQYWGAKITEALTDELEEDEILVNLASNEYYKSIKPALIENTIVTPQFKDYKNGKLKIISFFAKKARGMMVRYILDNDIDDLESLKGFNYGGYGLSEELSSENELIFIR
jgi:cytoplasmic iron level regulating protein YaaA (DUF328/UPF0246 family)